MFSPEDTVKPIQVHLSPFKPIILLILLGRSTQLPNAWR